MRKETGHSQIEKREILSNLLVISRKIDQGFYIEPRAYSEVYVIVLAIGRRRIKVGLSSKNPVKFDREEAVFENTEPKSGSLVLTRNVNQTIIIGSNTENPIKVTILATERDWSVKFGIYDPLKRLVLREELIGIPPKPTALTA